MQSFISLSIVISQSRVNELNEISRHMTMKAQSQKIVFQELSMKNERILGIFNEEFKIRAMSYIQKTYLS